MAKRNEPDDSAWTDYAAHLATNLRRLRADAGLSQEKAGWRILPEVIAGTRSAQRLVASNYPYSGDTQGDDRHVTHRPVDR